MFTDLGYKLGHALGTAWYRIKRNPVLVGAALLWGYEIASTGDPITLQGAITIGVGVLVRSKVVPANEVYDFSDTVEAVLEQVRDAVDAAEDGGT